MNDPLNITPFAQEAYNKEQLRVNNTGRAFGKDRPQLPIKEMMMIDRIIHISKTGGKHNQGEIIAEFDINPELWFFSCHFYEDPVMPGCLGLDALWQLLGFYLGWCGYPGKGRALGVKEVKFTDQITDTNTTITYHLHMLKYRHFGNDNTSNNKDLSITTLGFANGEVLLDKQVIYSATKLKVGILS